jgi:prepilin-type processing-associated H-X9-DG protein
MKKVKKGFYVTAWLGGNIAFWILFPIGIASMILAPKIAPPLAAVGLILYIFSFFPMIFAVVVGMVLLYKMWAAIEGPAARTTPGKAVGFLFIPFFNFYWFFQAYWGWAKDYNKMVKERQINAPIVPEGLALTISIFMVLGGIPYLGIIFGLVNLILVSVFFAKGCDAINALVDAGVEPQKFAAGLPMENAKTSGLAISSLVLGILGFFTVGLTSLLGLILGIVGLNSIKKSAGQLKGDGVALGGIIVSSIGLILIPIMLMLLAILLPAAAKGRDVARRVMCANNMKSLGTAMKAYANDNKGLYPASSQWCDLLVQKEGVDSKTFKCPGADKNVRSSYAMNINIGNLGTSAPYDMVLLFETTDGWNQYGGPEILSTDNHKGDGCNILFNDGHSKFVKSEDLKDLKWTADQNDLGPSAFLLQGHL